MSLNFLHRNITHYFLIASLFLFLTGCAGKPLTPIFYPGKPDPPRYQYLKTIGTSADLKQSSLVKALAEGGFAFQKAYGVAAYKKTLLVTDNRLRGYAVINFATHKLHFVSGDPSNYHSQMRAPAGIAVDAKGNRYIADRGSSRVLIFDQNEHYLRAIDFKGQKASPVDVAIDQDKLYIAQIKQNRIDVYDLKTNKLKQLQTGDVRLEWPVSLDFRNNRLYVVEMLQYQIAQLNRAGKLLKTYGSLGGGRGQLARPRGVAVDKDGRVLALDASFANFQIFRQDGQLLGAVAHGGFNPENLSLPSSICISYDLAPYFQKYAAPGFKLEYIVAVVNENRPSKVNIYGYGKMDGAKYSN